MNTQTGRESDKFMLRLPDGMRDRIKAAADQNNRSMNAEIIATLEAAYPSVDPPLAILQEFVRLLTPHFPESERNIVYKAVVKGAFTSLEAALDQLDSKDDLDRPESQETDITAKRA